MFKLQNGEICKVIIIITALKLGHFVAIFEALLTEVMDLRLRIQTSGFVC